MQTEPQPCYEHGHWYVDGEFLYIVPDDDYGSAETIGPDNDTLDALNAAYRKLSGPMSNINPREIAESLGLEFAPEWQRRFDPEVGYFIV